MPFIGNQPALSYTSFAVQHFTTSATTSYTLDHSVANENEIRLVINNVVQQPGSSYAYTASGTTLTLSAATSATDTMYAVFLGKAVQTVTPASGSVTNAMLAGSIDLTSKVTGTLPVANGGTNLSSGFKNGITMVDCWRISAGFTGNASPISSNFERNDSSGVGFIGTGMTESSGVFTFPSTGIYHVTFHATFNLNSNSRYNLIGVEATTNNSTYSEIAVTYTHISRNTSLTTYSQAEASAYVDVTDTSNVKVRFIIDHHDTNTKTTGASGNDYTWFRFVRIGDT